MTERTTANVPFTDLVGSKPVGNLELKGLSEPLPAVRPAN